LLRDSIAVSVLTTSAMEPSSTGLVVLHGGTLPIASEKCFGTTVTVTFPAEQVETL
jgi:hypothetical protein